MGGLGFAFGDAKLRAKHDVGQIRGKDEFGKKKSNPQESLFLRDEKKEGREDDLREDVEGEPFPRKLCGIFGSSGHDFAIIISRARGAAD